MWPMTRKKYIETDPVMADVENTKDFKNSYYKYV